MNDTETALPEALYPLRNGTYGNKQACESEHAQLFGNVASSPSWGKGALLLNPLTKSYLTPYGFKALFKLNQRKIDERFQRAGLDPKVSYYHDGAPAILIHRANGRFIPSTDLPSQGEILPLTQRFREEDVYLQNFTHDGSKRTGSYTPYTRANDWLRERHAKELAGDVQQTPASRSTPAIEKPYSPDRPEKPGPSPRRTFSRTLRDKRISKRRSQPHEDKKG